jgi:hypothetical protein
MPVKLSEDCQDYHRKDQPLSRFRLRSPGILFCRASLRKRIGRSGNCLAYRSLSGLFYHVLSYNR